LVLFFKVWSSFSWILFFVLDSFVNSIFLFNITFQFKVWWYLRLGPQCFGFKF
jgi:hypothetical protein